MCVITISREYGSDGRTVGLRAAKILGYHYVDKEIITEVAKQANVPVSEVERLDEKPESAAVRILRKFLAPSYGTVGADLAEHDWWTVGTLTGALQATHDSVFLDEDVYVRMTQEVIARLAERDNVVIIGRGGQAFLRDRLNVLHVRVIASRDFRIRTAIERDGLTREQAEREVRDTDEKRKTYLKRHYGVIWNSSEPYHLVVNTGRIGVDGAAGLVAQAARDLPFAVPA